MSMQCAETCNCVNDACGVHACMHAALRTSTHRRSDWAPTSMPMPRGRRGTTLTDNERLARAAFRAGRGSNDSLHTSRPHFLVFLAHRSAIAEHFGGRCAAPAASCTPSSIADESASGVAGMGAGRVLRSGPGRAAHAAVSEHHNGQCRVATCGMWQQHAAHGHSTAQGPDQPG